MRTIIGRDNLGLYCDVYDENGRKIVREFQNGYYETEEELKERAVKEVKTTFLG